MSDKLKKIDKEYLLTDSTLNCYKYRLLTSGYQLDAFKKNPIGYRMHVRETGVVVRWDDLRVDGDKVYGKPVINLSNPEGEKTVEEIQNGFLNAASVGHIVALEISTNPDDYLEGQEGPTISKWYNRECSLVDIPGNYNALTDLVDANEIKINLSDFSTKKFLKMKQIFFSPAQLALMNLKADAEASEVESAFTTLVAKAGKTDQLTAEKDKAVNDLAAFTKTVNEQKVNDLVAGAITEKRITKEAGEKLKIQYAGKPAELKDLLTTFQPYTPLTENLGAGKVIDIEASKMGWDALDKAGKLEDLKANDLPLFKTKFKEKFNKEYAG